MQIHTLGELLDALITLDARLELHYADIRDQSADDSAKMMTYHLSRLCRNVRLSLATVRPETSAAIRGEAIETDLDPEEFYEPIFALTPATATSGKLIASAQGRIDKLVSVYRQLIKTGRLGPAATDLLGTLTLTDERELLRLQKIARVSEFMDPD